MNNLSILLSSFPSYCGWFSYTTSRLDPRLERRASPTQARPRKSVLHFSNVHTLFCMCRITRYTSEQLEISPIRGMSGIEAEKLHLGRYSSVLAACFGVPCCVSGVASRFSRRTNQDSEMISSLFLIASVTPSSLFQNEYFASGFVCLGAIPSDCPGPSSREFS